MATQPIRGPRKPGSRSLGWLGFINTSYTNSIRTERVDARGRTVKAKPTDKVAQASTKPKELPQGSDDALETLRNTMALENAKKSANT